MPVYETVKDHYLEQEIIFNLYRNKSRNLHKSKFLSLNLQWKNGNPSEYKSRIGAIFRQKWSRKFGIFNLKSNILTENQQKEANLEYNRGGLVSISKLIVTFVSLNNFIFCYFGLCWINELNFVTSTCSVLNLTIVIR